MRRSVTRAACTSVALATMLAAAAAQAQSVKIDVGNGIVIEQDTSKPLRVAMFMPATNTSYLQANIKGATDAATKYGGTVNVFDGKFAPMTQLNQMQNAVQTGQYNGFLILPLAGQVICEMATSTAPKANILVSSYHDPVCDKQLALGEDQWSPGMLQFVGDGSSYEAFSKYVEAAIKANPGKRKVGVLTGMELVADTVRMDKVVEDVKKKYPDFQIVSVARTDYTVPTSHQRTQNMIQSQPDIDVLISVYAGITRGMVEAVDQAGKSGKIKIYDFGGSKWSKEAIEKGQIELTVPLYAYSAGYKAVENMALARQGKKVARLVPNEGGPTDAPFLLTKANIGKFEPESD